VTTVKRASLAVATVLGFALAARAVSGELDASLFAGVPEGVRISVLVVLREQADLSGAEGIADRAERRRFVFDALSGVASRSQAPLAARLRAEGISFRSHYLINMVEVETDRALAEEIAARPEVARLASNRPSLLRRVPEAQPSDGAVPLDAVVGAPGPNLERIGAPKVWALGYAGENIVIGDADTGFDWGHPALHPHYRGSLRTGASHGWNWHDAVHDAAPGNVCGSDAIAPCDDDGHGTSTSALAVGDDGIGDVVGVAPRALLIGCRNMDHGAGTPARYTECFEFFLAPDDGTGKNLRPDLGADVINNSWGCPPSEGCTDPEILKDVVERVRAAGIFVVVSAGNGGSGCETVLDAPAIYEASFSIGATNNVDGIAGFSSRGPVTQDGSNRLKPEICAPGVSVRTAVKGGGFTNGFSGTSASAPHVAGAVALLWSADPSLRGNVDSTEQLLLATATPLTSDETCGAFPGSAVPNAVFGYGRIDIAAAVALALSGSPRVLVRPHAHSDARPRLLAPRTP